MKFLIVSGNPKNDGLCKSVEEAIIEGATSGGAETAILNVHGINRCRVCHNGWGTCKSDHKCTFGDDGFNEAYKQVVEADALCLISPVYWGEVSEDLKAFLDRMRRCVYSAPGALSGKQVLLVASPGGSGNNMISCMEQMERFCRHTNASVFDYIGVNRWNCQYKREAARNAAKAMVEFK